METCREPEPEPEDQIFLNPEEEEDEEEEEKEEDEEDEEEDAIIFNAWMQCYRGGERQRKKTEDEEEDDDDGEEVGGGRPGSSLGHTVRNRTDRRASLPCSSTLSSMQLSRLHSSTCPPVSARVLLHRSSSRRLLPSPLESQPPPPPSVFTPSPRAVLERRPSLIQAIPEATTPERRSQFRRRNLMSMSDAYSVCLICHDDLNRGSGGTQELQCNHTFHKECIEEWLWRKHSCPTCRVQVSVQQSVYDCVEVP